MPRFLEMERDYGSLIRASIYPRTSPKKTDVENPHKESSTQADMSGGARYGLFAGLKGGMNDLIEALGASVAAHCQVRLNCPVISVLQPAGRQTHSNTNYVVKFADGQEESFNAVIVASTAARAADLLESLDLRISNELRGIEYASSAIVTSGHRLADIRHPLNSFGLVIPHNERRRILAVSFSSRKFPNRAPEGRVLLRTFVGGALQPELFAQNDEQMISSVIDELDQIFGVRGEPDFVRVFRYKNAMPQYHVGHLTRISKIEALTRQHNHLALAGIAYRGVGIPDVITNAERAAEELFSSRW
jgi:oxygen-dependent protoporphyrinogen oxidase